MTWDLEWGPHIEKIRRSGVPNPPEPPDLPEDLEWAYMAFLDLSSSRQIGMAVGAIPFGAVDRYAARYGIGDFEEFHALIKAMDAAFLTHQRK